MAFLKIKIDAANFVSTTTNEGKKYSTAIHISVLLFQNKKTKSLPNPNNQPSDESRIKQ